MKLFAIKLPALVQVFAIWMFCAAPLCATGIPLDNSFAPKIYGYGQVPEMAWNPVSEWLYCRVIAERMNGQVLTTNLIRFTDDGEWDDTWALDHDGDITCIAVQDDGKLLIGGDFTAVDGHSTFRVARINVDGSVDTSITLSETDLPALDSIGVIDALAADDGGNIYVGIYDEIDKFDDFSEYTEGVLFCFGPGRDTFNVNLSQYQTNGYHVPGAGYGVRSIHVDDNGLMIGGSFLSINGENIGCIARIGFDGALDSSFNVDLSPVPGFSTYFDSSTFCVDKILEAADGNLWVGGNFTKSNAPGIIRISPSGSVLTAEPIISGNRTYQNGYIKDIAVDGIDALVSGIILVGTSGSLRHHISSKLDTTGTMVTDYNAGSLSDSIAHTNGTVIIGKGLDHYSGGFNDQPAMGFFTTNGDKLENDQVNLFIPVGANRVWVRPDNRPIYYGEQIAGVNDAYVDKLFALNEDGSTDNSFSVDFSVNYLAEGKFLHDGRLLLIGSFSRDDWPSTRGVLLLDADGGLAPPFDHISSQSIPDWYNPAALYLSSGKVLLTKMRDIDDRDNASLVTLNFDRYQEILAALPADGDVDPDTYSYAWDSGLFSEYAVDPSASTNTVACIQPSGKVILASAKERLNVDGSLDPTFSPPNDFHQFSVENCFSDALGRLYLYGIFIRNAGDPSVRLIRLMPDGALDESYACSLIVAVKRGVYLDAEGNFYISGYVTSHLGTAYMARVKPDGSIDEDFYFIDDQSWFLEVSAPQSVYANSKRYLLPSPISSQISITPAIAQANEGEDITFWLADRGADETYQWLLGGETLTGQTGPSLTIDPTTLADAGEISVEATNTGGAVIRTAELRVAGFDFNQWGAKQGYTPSELLDPEADLDRNGLSLNSEFLLRTDLGGVSNRSWAAPIWDGEALQLQWRMLPGRRYWVDCSTNLVSWTPVASYVGDAAETVSMPVEFDPETPCFYQVRVELIDE